MFEHNIKLCPKAYCPECNASTERKITRNNLMLARMLAGESLTEITRDDQYSRYKERRMTEERIREAIKALSEDEQKGIRDAFYSAASGLQALVDLLTDSNPDLAKELTIATEARALISRSQICRVL